MERLIAANQSNLYKSGPAQRGFVCTEPGARVSERLRGMTKLISGVFRRRGGRTTPPQRRLKLFTLPPGVSPIASSLRTGDIVHRHLDRILSDPMSAPSIPSNEQPSIVARVEAGLTFVDDSGHVPVASEVVVRIAGSAKRNPCRRSTEASRACTARQ